MFTDAVVNGGFFMDVLQVTLRENNKACKMAITLYSSTSSTHYFDNFLFSDSLTLNNEMYYKVYHQHKNEMSLYYNKTDGFIGYRSSDGTLKIAQ
jgi:hypothetical protein